MSDPGGPTRTDASGDETRAADSDDSLLRDALGMSPRVPRPVLVPGSVLDDVYRIERELGVGGMGVVYLARDVRLERDVAIKLHTATTSEPQGERLLREARTMAQLVHPNVATVFEAGTWQGHPFVVMEYVEGGTARSWLAEAPRAPREIVELYLAAARGLAAAHGADVVHRDFKPDNVLVGRDGRVRVADFGLATSFAAETTIGTEAVAGTPAYMAPEQRRGGAIGPAADQFAFGVALWEALAGKRPWSEGTTEDRDAATLPEVPASQMPAALRRVLVRALAADPVARFPSMTAVIDAIARAMPAPGRRRRIAIALVAATALAGGGAIAAWSLTGKEVSAAEACRASDAPIREVWNPERARVLRAAFTTNGPSFADAAAGRSIGRLDAYSSTWSAQRIATCQAAHSGTQTHEHAHRRAACLDRQLQDLDALVAVLGDRPSPAIIDRSVDLVFALSPPEACDDPTRIAGIAATPEHAPEYRETEVRIAQARALHGAGLFERGLAVAQDAMARADKLADPRLAAEARYWAGYLSSETGKREDARKLLEDAATRAAAIKDDYLAASVWIALLSIVVGGERDVAAAERYLPVAQAALVRVGSPAALEGPLVSIVGFLRTAQGKLDEALTNGERALQLLETAYAPGDPRLASYMNRLANAYVRAKRDADALAMYERAEKLLLDSYGPDHPNVARVRHGRANLLSAQGEHEAAYKLATEVVASKERLLGREHPELAASLAMLGQELVKLGRANEALPHVERAIALAEPKYGRDHPMVAYAWSVRGDAHVALGDRAGAIEAYERVVASGESKLPPTSTELADARFALAQQLWHGAATRARALGLARAARDVYDKARSKQLEAVDAWLAGKAK